MAPIDAFSLKDFDRTFAVNVRAVFVATQAAVKHMKEGGRIINIGSCNAERMPFAGGAVYAMSKAALVGLVKGLARDLAGGRGPADAMDAKGRSNGVRYSGAGWADPDNEYWPDGYTVDGVTTGGPCMINCNNNNEAYAFHTGGCLGVFGDGSVRFIRESDTRSPSLPRRATRVPGEVNQSEN